MKLRIGKTRNSDEGVRILERPVSKTVSVFDSPTRKHRRSELVQDNLVILGEPRAVAPWRSAPLID